jgi:hypothetical protein
MIAKPRHVGFKMRSIRWCLKSVLPAPMSGTQTIAICASCCPCVNITCREKYKIMQLFGFLHCLVARHSDVLKLCTAFTLWVTDSSLYHCNVHLIQSPWRWRQYVPLKYQNIEPLHDAKTQKKTVIWKNEKVLMKLWLHPMFYGLQNQGTCLFWNALFNNILSF